MHVCMYVYVVHACVGVFINGQSLILKPHLQRLGS